MVYGRAVSRVLDLDLRISFEARSQFPILESLSPITVNLRIVAGAQIAAGAQIVAGDQNKSANSSRGSNSSRGPNTSRGSNSSRGFYLTPTKGNPLSVMLRHRMRRNTLAWLLLQSGP